MKKWFYRTTQGILLCCLAAALPVMAQDNHPQSDEHSTHQNQAQKPEHRAQQQEHNAGHPQTQRPNHGDNHVQQQPNRGNYHSQQSNRGERPSPTRAQQQRPNTNRPNHGRPAQWGHQPAHRGSYQFRSNDRDRLHSYYTSRLRAINRANRPVFRVGGYFPYAYIDYISPLPPELYETLPPPPPGYEMGYYDGYVVVYDPVTYFIVSVIDLLQ